MWFAYLPLNFSQRQVQEYWYFSAASLFPALNSPVAQSIFLAI